MKESHREDLPSHPDPESCVGGRKAAGEALTGTHAGQPLSCEIRSSGVPTPLSSAEGNTVASVSGEPATDPARSKTLSIRGNSLHGNREIPLASAVVGARDRPEKVDDRTCGVHAGGKSDGRVVPKKPPNKGTMPAEVVEERRPTKGNTDQATAPWTQSQNDALLALMPVRPCKSSCRFTLPLPHHWRIAQHARMPRLPRLIADGLVYHDYPRKPPGWTGVPHLCLRSTHIAVLL